MKHERVLKNLAWQSAGLFENVGHGAKTIDELKSLNNMLRQLPQWKQLLVSGKTDVGVKLQINQNLLDGKLSELCLSLFQLLTEYQLISEMDVFIRELEKAFKSRMNVAFVSIAYPPALSQSELMNMKNALSGQIEKSIVWHEKPDDQIIGGVKIKVDYQLYDATVNHQLEMLRRLMESN